LKKYLITILITIFISGIANAQSGSYTGSFARLGFGARGLAMGNAMVSNIFGDVSGYYNPAISSFQEDGIVNIGYTFLSMDRSLNFVGFTKKFTLPNQENRGAGISLSWINAGVNDIDGRDNDTRQIGNFSTFDNQFYLGTSFLVSDQVSLGVGFKLYYSKLYEDVTSTSIGFDLGAVYKAMDNLSFGFAIRDLSAKNEWNTSDLYGSLGNTTEDKFPTLINFGGTYLLPKNYGLVSLEIEYHNNPKYEDKNTGETSERFNEYFFKFGTELFLTDHLKLRGGLERIDFSNEDFGGNLKPSAGFGFYKSISKSIILGVDYSFAWEPYSHDPFQNLSLAFKFK
jgi:hypothetical protein